MIRADGTAVATACFPTLRGIAALVDTVALLQRAVVHPADIQDRDGDVLLLSAWFGLHPFMVELFADAGNQGPRFAKGVAEVLPYLSVEIVKHSGHASSFVVLPMR